MPVAHEIVRDPSKRCASNVVEKPGRTHWCFHPVGHAGDHMCLCSRAWPRKAVA